MQKQRELSSFPLPPLQRMKLQQLGFLKVEDVLDLKPTELAKEMKISPQEALEILKLVKEEGAGGDSTKQSKTRTALDMLHDEQLQQSIITFSEQLDEMLGGGVPLTKITEFCGAPGIGKTQICMQLAVDVQIPEVFGGVGGEVVYIDTEGSFIVHRVADIAKTAVQHCRHISDADGTQESKEAIEHFTLESILSRIHYYRCHDYVELIAVVHLLPDFLKAHPQVKLVIVDSIAFPFRHDFEDMALRTRLLNGMAQTFIKLATQFRLAVVLTNQMTTRVSHDRMKGSQLIPALGESWGHAATIRVILFWDHNTRLATLYKSPSRGETTVPYQITMGGIRDIASPTLPQTSASCSDATAESSSTPPSKRQRLNPHPS